MLGPTRSWCQDWEGSCLLREQGRPSLARWFPSPGATPCARGSRDAPLRTAVEARCRATTGKWLMRMMSPYASRAESRRVRVGDIEAVDAPGVSSGWHRVCRVTTTLKVICSRCQQEGKPSLLVTIDIPGDDREIHGLCWTHRLRLLARSTDSTPSREPGAR